MPGWDFHVKHSISDKKHALEISKALDIDPLQLFSHHQWRKLTHQPHIAILIGYAINGKKGAVDAMRHLLHDLMYNPMIAAIEAERRRREGIDVEEVSGEEG
ncbi:MAG: hypothetical protein ACXQTD_04285 [Candidatus Syntropharchaeia archaeon]